MRTSREEYEDGRDNSLSKIGKCLMNRSESIEL